MKLIFFWSFLLNGVQKIIPYHFRQKIEALFNRHYFLFSEIPLFPPKNTFVKKKFPIIRCFVLSVICIQLLYLPVYSPVLLLLYLPVSVEYPRHPNFYSFLFLISVAHGFCHSFPFVITRSRSNRIHVTPIEFVLRMFFRVSVNLRSRSQK